MWKYGPNDDSRARTGHLTKYPPCVDKRKHHAALDSAPVPPRSPGYSVAEVQAMQRAVATRF